MVRVSVTVEGSTYDVVVGTGLLEEAATCLPELGGAEKAFVVADPTVAGAYLDTLAGGLDPLGLRVLHLGVPAGEEAKSLQSVAALHHQLATQEAHRDDVVIALGGGSVGDLAGFVAATYMRGVRFIQVPTTLTAQVDAAIGGKTGVNLPEGKNLVGAFHQPVAVLADVATLGSLPDREFRSGLAEVAKYGLALDPSLLEVLDGRLDGVLARDPLVMEDVVARCVRTKAAVVGSDERDVGARLVLNYGHTLGHALERLDEFSGRSHGEAVAVGMTFAARVAEAVGMARPGLAARHARTLNPLGLEPDGRLPAGDRILDAMRMDKKYRGGIRFVLLEDVGRPIVADEVPEDVVVTVLKEMGAAG
ncbi:MAG: 3-dehydroquinate synthase [Actinobacteria bacterium]|nr:MAG: 3-dehydroquinate synthase [Actinomycetota bacterium]